MPIDWKETPAFTRLLAAMVAAQDMKLDYKKIASMYGRGATYDAIEGRFRIIKKDAAALKAEADSNGDRPARSSASNTPKKPRSTPKKDKTVGGRVGKSGGGTNYNETMTTPSKKRKGNGIKQEGGGSFSTSFLLDAIPVDDEDENAAAAGDERSKADVEGDDLSLYYEDGGFAAEGMDIEAF